MPGAPTEPDLPRMSSVAAADGGQGRIYSLLMNAEPDRSAEARSDAALMAAFADGEMAAFDALYARHRGALYAYLARLLSPGAGSVDDLFQEVWIRVTRERARYRPEAAFRTWLFTIARNLTIDLVRRHRPLLASQLLHGDDDGDPLDRLADERRPSAEETLDAKRMNARLHGALASLPAVQREAILLREYGEHSIEDIARITGVNAETAKSRLRYALGKLRSLLMPYKEPQS